MIYMDELKNLWLYNKKVHLPINYKNKYRGSCIILLTPSINSSIDVINHPLLINKYHNGYYIEKDILYFINNENHIVGNIDDLELINETGEYILNENAIDIINEDLVLDEIKINRNDYILNDNSIIINTKDDKTFMALFDDIDDLESIQEGSNKHNYILKKLLYEERFRRVKDVFEIHDIIKRNCPAINKFFINYKRYRKFNIFVDFYYYTETFFKNNIFKLERGLELYFDFMNRFLKDKRLNKYYNLKHVIIPVHEWKKFVGDVRINLYKKTLNPISVMYRLMLMDLPRLQREWGDIPFIFLGENQYFIMDFSKFKKRDLPRFLNYIYKLEKITPPKKIKVEKDVIIDKKKEKPTLSKFVVLKKDEPPEVPKSKKEKEIIIPKEKEMIDDKIKDVPLVHKDEKIESVKSIVTNVIDNIEKKSNIKINNLTGSGVTDKDELVNRINNAALSSLNADEALDKLEEDPEIKRMILDISNQERNMFNTVTATRGKRISKLREDFLKIEVDNKKVEDILTKTKPDAPIKTTKLEIDSINENWGSLKSLNFEELYDVEEDLLKIVDDLSSETKTTPVNIRDIKKEDTSTSENYVSTYSFDMEDFRGKRFKLNLDIPEFEDDKYLMLKGNRKVINRQLMLLPVVKTDKDTVQIVTNYNKVFLERFGLRSYVISDRLVKMLDKLDDIPGIRVIEGDCSRANSKYNVPIDYNEIADKYTTINTKDFIFMFNQKEIRDKYKDIFKEKKDSFPIGYDKNIKQIIYCDYNAIYSEVLKELLLSQNKKLIELYDKTNPAKKHTYTRISILNNKIPLILILAYNEGLTNIMDKARIEYKVVEKRPKYDKDKYDIIRFKDSYIIYENDYETSLLMNGIKECNTEDYSIIEINNKSMYLDFLDSYGGRILADGLDNFYECMIDPITKEVLDKYNLPTDYVSLLLYASDLLADTSYIKHVDMTGVRFRSNEIVSACIYKVLSTAYGDYKNELKRGRRNARLSVKKTAVIDELLSLNIISDVSHLSPILEAESLHTVSTKGPSGMNNERAYGLDKRAYHPTMINVLGMSTPQGKNVGVNRQTTIDMNIEGKRGYINLEKNKDNMTTTKTLTVSEAMTPFGVTRDDPPRTSMNLSQAEHTMPVKHSDPLLITNGVDEALPYMISDIFAHKAKIDGMIKEITDDFMIIEYKDNETEFIDLREKTLKNSGGGFYITSKLDTDLKEGQKIKANDIVAYNKQSFSKTSGHSNNITTNSGTLVKFAILNTDDGFEDSAIISEKISSKMASDVVIKKDIYLGKNANIYNMVKKGQSIQEGEPLVIFQESFDDEDVSLLLRNLVDDEEIISNLGKREIVSKYTGSIQDIKMYRTVDKNELTPSLKREVNKYEKGIKDIKEIMEKYNVKYANRFSEPNYKLEPTGKLKNVLDGVLIEFYIKYEDKMAIGDKLTFFIALKGIIKDIFPEGKEPYTDFRKDEKIDALLSAGSINARMTCSIKINMLINKILIELSRSVKDILGIKYDVNE